MNTKSLIIGCAALASAGLFLSTTTTQAAVVAVGVEGGASPTFTAQNWSNPNVAKTYSVNGSNVYGSAGYYVLAPTLDAAVTSTAVTAGDLNNGPLGGPALQTPSVKPTFLNAEVQSLGGTWVNFPGYAVITRPDPSSVYRVGGISMVTTVTGGSYGSFTDAVYFTVAAGANFRFGIMTDATGGFGTRAFSIYESYSGGVTYSAALTQDSVPDLALFDINNTSGAAAQYNVALHLAAPAGGTGTFSMLTFDVIPEPSTWLLLSAGLCVVFFLRRRRMA